MNPNVAVIPFGFDMTEVEGTTVSLYNPEFRTWALKIDKILETYPQAECPLKHTFLDGLYIREIFLPADSLITSRVHTYSCTNILLKGKVRVWSESLGVQELTAPCRWVSPPGTKRIIYVYEDTVWLTLHRLDTTDVAEAEEELFSWDYETYESKIKLLEGELL